MNTRLTPEKPFYIGLMSGTSLDGVDAVLCQFEPEFVLLQHYAVPIEAQLKAQLTTLQSPSANEIHLAQTVSQHLARLYAEAVIELLSKANLQAESIQAIGCHGQTIRHRASENNPYSLQLNNAALLAELTHINVISDFRSRDIAAGGQGAPLVPAFHADLFQHSEHDRLILNLGGMANLTHLPALTNQTAITGFDCGPANVLLDAWIQKHRGQTYDHDGSWAKSGKLDRALLGMLLEHPFFKTMPPKSCGREEFNLNWLEQSLQKYHSIHASTPALQDVQATLLELTAQSIANAIDQFYPSTKTVYVCGGGAYNPALLQRFTDLCSAKFATTEQLGLPVQTVEAAAFSWLAWYFMQGKHANLPSVTGARGTRILGALYPA